MNKLITSRLVCLLSALILTACSDDNSAPQPQPSSGEPPPPAQKFVPYVSAHRGGAAYAPENTMAAYRNAVRLGVDDLETDTQLSADGLLVLIHDDTLERTTDCTGAVNAKTFEELQACDAAFWFSPGQPTTVVDENAPHPLRGRGVKIPAAQELFDYAKTLGSNGPTVTIELKNIPGETGFTADCEPIATQLVELIQQSGILERTVVQSFWPVCVDNVKTLDPGIRTLFLTSSTPQGGAQVASSNLAYVIAQGHDISAPNFDAPDFGADYIAAAHDAGKLVVPYTADTEADIQMLMDLGADGIITNFPACQLQLQNRPLPPSVLVPEAGTDSGFPRCRP